ncbi:Leukotriene A-4 hydrolase [Trachymyrmex cornetzi]|uniref:Leukotriene A-4 hydrolase n=1 Tax=Trachymyrmex cornetzi TaxID=471704 RepID=A0A151IVR2_9HYME|nr:Leukotriene A-4 hydrolase [Trachymyrmex cornetzi]
MDTDTFEFLLEKVTPLIKKQNTHLRESIPPDERLSVTLRHLATGESQESLALTFRLGRSTISKIIKEVKFPFPLAFILDNYALVTNPVTEASLEHSIGHKHIVGSSFIIQLSKTEEKYNDYKPTCKIQIEYETSPDSPTLYWLTPAQIADDTHPFLLSNNKLTFARAVFSCQDTSSVKFSYTATITVPKDFTAIMSALWQNVIKDSELNLYNFLQAKQVASYAVIIAVDSLQKKHLSIRSNVFAEKKFINEAVNTLCINWNLWFYNTPRKHKNIDHETTWEIECLKLAETWARWDDDIDDELSFISILYKKKDFCDIEEIVFLNTHYIIFISI